MQHDVSRGRDRDHRPGVEGSRWNLVIESVPVNVKGRRINLAGRRRAFYSGAVLWRLPARFLTTGLDLSSGNKWTQTSSTSASGDEARQFFAAKFPAGYIEGSPASDGYLRFLVEELKPLIDARYRSLPDQPNTCIMGSSMGGLVSLYAIAQYPEVFGGAGCLSTHWIAGENMLVDYLGERLPPPANHRLYFDFGTITLDEAYEPFQVRMDGWLSKAGYALGQNWTTLKFEGAAHTEAAWRARVDLPLRFLLSQQA
ncbi:MAG: hypothetical protein IPO29_18440 [Anaerolineae bacterium]|nr:hypothetical protein [Anaerolineae bacterium]